MTKEELIKKIEKEKKWLVHALNDKTDVPYQYSVDIAFEAVNYHVKDYINSQQKTGRWIESKGRDDIDHFYVCSECGRYINLKCGSKLSDYPYCHCGAKMEEVEE